MPVARVADLPLAVDMFRYMAGWATKITGSTLSLSTPGEYLSYTMKEPVGVVAQIIPWNFPLLMACWKIRAGGQRGLHGGAESRRANPRPPSSRELILEAGFRAGCGEHLTGFGEAGAAMAAHPDVDKVAFTRSTEVGKLIVQHPRHLKKVHWNWRKSPAIILGTPTSTRRSSAANAIFFNHGQCCCAGSRLLRAETITTRSWRAWPTSRRGSRLARLPRTAELGPLASSDE